MHEVVFEFSLVIIAISPSEFSVSTDYIIAKLSGILISVVPGVTLNNFCYHTDIFS